MIAPVSTFLSSPCTPHASLAPLLHFFHFVLVVHRVVSQSVSQLASLELNGVHMHTFKKLLLGVYLFESSLTVVSRHKVNHHSSAVHHKQVDLRREGSRWLAPRPPVTSAAGLVAEAPAVVRGVDGFRQVWDQRQRRHGAIRASGNLEFSTVCVDGMRDFMSMLDYAQLLVHYNI